MSDEMLRRLADIVDEHTRPGADPEQWVMLPVGEQFEMQDLGDNDLFVGSVEAAEHRGPAWLRAILEWDGTSPWGEVQTAWPGLAWPSPLVSERLCCYLHLLGAGFGVDRDYFPGAIELAQRRLAMLLLEHPVLMHPRLRVRTSDQHGKGKVSVAHAVGLAQHGAFPMERHGATKEQLERFANHPCTLLGLRSRHVKVPGQLRMAVGYRVLSLALGQYENHPQLIASIYELDKLVKPAIWPVRVEAMPFLRLWPDSSKTVEPQNPFKVHAECFLAACGSHLNAGVGRRPVWQWHESPEYLALLKETGTGNTPDFIAQLRMVLHAALIPGSIQAGRLGLLGPMQGAGPGYDQVVDGCQRVLRGIVTCGLKDTEPAAAQAVREMLQFSGPPHCQLEHALAVIRTLAQHGVDMTAEDFTAPETRGAWIEALRVHRTEVDMAKVIRETVDAAEPVAPEVSRGRRHSL